MALLGYARVSTNDQRTDLQLAALTDAGCDRVFVDHGVSGKIRARPELDRLLDHMRPGDVVMCWRLDRLARSLRDLLNISASLTEHSVDLQSITEGISTDHPTGRLTFHILGAVAEMEAALNAERTRAGLEQARRRGARFGRPPALSSEQIGTVRRLTAAGESRRAVARLLAVSSSTIQRVINHQDPATVS